MKKISLFLALMLSVVFAAVANNETKVLSKELPSKIKKVIDENFSDNTISYIEKNKTMSRTEYEVAFTNGDKIEFDGKEEWKEIESKKGKVPEKLIPSQISSYINKNHPHQYVKKIERDSRGYEVKLDNGLELEFDRNQNFIHYDD